MDQKLTLAKVLHALPYVLDDFKRGAIAAAQIPFLRFRVLLITKSFAQAMDNYEPGRVYPDHWFPTPKKPQTESQDSESIRRLKQQCL